ncbi:MAG: hypothetical protein HFH68_12460 [Lachnospiraceae bacterium]|nr:hypothetical protein [Lachnospiraceae bacterium]
MKRKSIAVGIIVMIGMVVSLSIYGITKSNTLGNITYSCKQQTSSISDFTFEGERGDNLKFSFSSNVENGSLDIMLCGSDGNTVYELDRAKELVTWFTLEKADTYTLVAEYSNFVGNFKIKITT